MRDERLRPGHRPRGRVIELDGLRGVAVLAVVAAHAGLVSGAGGAVGVTVFFVLSGYLITGLLTDEQERTGRVDLTAFWARRAARLAPALLLMVAVMLAWRASTDQPSRWLPALYAVTYTQNIATAHFHVFAGLFSHTWTLALEEQFYLLWPLAVIWLRSRRALLLLAVAVLAVSLASRELWAGAGELEPAYTAPLSSCYALAAGCALALRRPRLPPRSGAIATAGILAAAVLPIGVEDREVLIVQTVATALTCAVVLAPPTLLAVPLLRWVGDRSYGLYLWHRPLLLSPPAIWLPEGWRQAVGVALAVAAAAASYRWLEVPIRRAVRQRPRQPPSLHSDGAGDDVARTP